MTNLELDRANTINEMQRHANFLRSLPAERPGAGRLAGRILLRPDDYIADLDAAIKALGESEWPAPGSPLERTLLKWIGENNRAADMPGQDPMGRGLHHRIAACAVRILERAE